MSNLLRTFQNEQPIVGNRVYIDPQAVIIGNVTLGNDVSVWPMAIIRGDVNFVRIGNGCNIQDASVLHVTHDGPYSPGGYPLILEEGVTIGHRVTLHGCHIESYCLIGIGTIIMDGVHIEDHVLVGAGSLVPPGKTLKSGHLYLGNPAKPVRVLKDEEIAQLEYSAVHYIKVKNKYLSG